MPISNPLKIPQSIGATIPNAKAGSFVSYTWEFETTQARQILPVNLNRQSLSIFNRGPNAVLIDVFSTEPQNYMLHLEAGAFYEMPGHGIYTGSFQAKIEGTLDEDNLTILEVRDFES